MPACNLATDNLFIVSVPVLSTYKISMLAASSGASNRVTNTPFFTNSFDPKAMQTVNIAVSATGIAPSNNTNIKGKISNKSIPLIKETTSATINKAPTISNSHFTTFAITSLMCDLGLAVLTNSMVLPNLV